MNEEDDVFDDANDDLDGPGPWFTATHESDTSCCGWADAGDVIRADGDGGWEHRDC